MAGRCLPPIAVSNHAAALNGSSAFGCAGTRRGTTTFDAFSTSGCVREGDGRVMYLRVDACHVVEQLLFESLVGRLMLLPAAAACCCCLLLLPAATASCCCLLLLLLLPACCCCLPAAVAYYCCWCCCC